MGIEARLSLREAEEVIRTHGDNANTFYSHISVPNHVFVFRQSDCTNGSSSSGVGASELILEWGEARSDPGRERGGVLRKG